jgi:hypothetical protein
MKTITHLRNVFPENRRKSSISLVSRSITEEMLSAEDFLSLAKDNPGIIKSSRAILPPVGAGGFGAFLVRYAYPRHVGR